MRNASFCLAVFLLLGSVAAARDIFVNNAAGDDRATGVQSRGMADLSGAVRTIAKALRLAGAGDHILLADTGRPYRESITLEGSRHSGSAVGPLVIDGNGAALDGTAPVPPEGWKHYRENIFSFSPQRMGSQALFLGIRPAVRVPTSQVTPRVPKLAPRQWCLFEGSIYFAVAPNKLPPDYALSYAKLPTGITLYHVEHVLIKDLTVQGFQVDGISAQNSARRVSLREVTCSNNGHAGLVVGGASQLEIDGCQLNGNAVAQALTLPYSEFHIYRSELRGDAAPAWLDQGGRVYLGQKRVQGGMDAIKRADVK
jgi:hypothetical protein